MADRDGGSAAAGGGDGDPPPSHDPKTKAETKDKKKKKKKKPVARLDAPVSAMHGRLGSAEWAAPRVAAVSGEVARRGYDSCDAQEYVDEPDMLQQKIDLLAGLVKSSESLLVYTGAGISTASGLEDYATKAAQSVTHSVIPRPSENRLKAQPTLSHRVLAAMHKAGYVKHWVNQNHDGLAQKAGYPQEALNEIHGSWFDRKNPVVLMDDSLRPDLFEWLCEWEQKTDLVLAMGSSLCGMNSDRVVSTACGKAAEEPPRALGAVIVNLQCTKHDANASLRIFARLDDAMALLAKSLRLRVPKTAPRA